MKTKLFFKNKKVQITAGLLIAFLLVGTTYAWFTSRSNSSTSGPDLGRLIIDSELDINKADILYEPGMNCEVKGTVSNVGTLPFIAKVDLTSQTTIRSDESGKALGEESYYQLSNISGIDITMDKSFLGYKDGANDAMMAWLVDSEGNYYLFIEGTMTADVAYNVYFGKTLGNKLQGASVSLDSEWLAVQANGEATLEIFGVDYDDLAMVINDLNAVGGVRAASASSSTSYTRIQTRLDELFGSNN